MILNDLNTTILPNFTEYSIKLRWIFFLIFPILHSNCRDFEKKSLVGVYTSHLPRIGPLIKVKEKKHHAKMVPMSVYMLYLRKDYTYVMGGCDLQIREVGNYKVENDSIYFFDIFNFKKNTFDQSKKFFFDKSNNSVYWRHTNPDAITYKKYPESVAILELDFIRGHRGFLRNQEMDKDSLLSYNKFLPYDEQMVWVREEIKKRGL